MPKVLPEYLELRRQQIVDAAASCFARSGFHQTTMQDICKEADLSPGAVYRYFRSKDEIIQAMTERDLQANADAIRNVQELGSLERILDELVQLYFVGTENLEVCALSLELVAESRRDPVIMQSLQQSTGGIRDSLRDIVRDAIDRGELPADINAESMARVMLGLYEGLIWQKLVEPEMDTIGYAEVTRRLFAGLLTTQTATASQPAALRH